LQFPGTMAVKATKMWRQPEWLPDVHYTRMPFAKFLTRPTARAGQSYRHVKEGFTASFLLALPVMGRVTREESLSYLT
jgi:hypothetical protein